MPVTTPQVMITLTPALIATGMLGISTPKLAQAIGIGLSTWTPSIRISTLDTGSAGVGAGTPVPVVLAQPLLYTNLLVAMSAQGLIGILAPAFTLGLATGLVAVYAQALTSTVHPGVGVGAGVASFSAPSAFSALQNGMRAMGMTGSSSVKLSRAIAQGLDVTFSATKLPQPIVGPASPTAGGGTGTGIII